MDHNKQFGKLIISRTNAQYDTFHDLDLIVIKGSSNQVSIDHDVTKLIIYGDNNNLNISSTGNIDRLILKGDNNTILAKYLYSISTKNFGSGNSIYMKSKESNDSEDDDDNDDNENDEEGEYEDQKENDDNEEMEQDEEEEEEHDNHHNQNHINIDLEDELYNNEDENDNDEDNDDSFYDNYYYLDSISPFLGSSILSIQRSSDLLSERRNIFREAVARIMFENINSHSYVDIDNVLDDLVDISYKKVSNDIKNNNEKCAVCYENFEENEKVKMTGCFHIFHYMCIKKWIEAKAESPDCPICRRKL